MATREAKFGNYSTSEEVTATNMNKAPGGWLGYAEATSDQGSITTEADLTGVTVSVTVNTSRRLLIMGTAQFYSSVDADRVALRIKADGSQVASGAALCSNSSSNPISVVTWTTVTPSAGAHTYKLAAARTSGTGNITMTAGSTSPASIVVYDLEPTS